MLIAAMAFKKTGRIFVVNANVTGRLNKQSNLVNTSCGKLLKFLARAIIYSSKKVRSAFLSGIIGLMIAGCASANNVSGAKPGILYEHHGLSDQAVVVLSHDWFGDSEYYRSFGEELASEGYSVIASDLYEGRPGGKTHAEAWALLKSLTAEHAASVLDQNIELATQQSDRVIVIGFSAGAPHALQAAIRNSDDVDGVILFYGDTTKDVEQLARLKGPILAIYGSKDPTYGDVAASEEAALFMKAADEAKINAEVHIFGGQDHAFAQPLYNAGKTYDATAAAAAMQLTQDYLKRISQYAENL